LLFRNGVFNIETQEFVAGFDKTLVFTTHIDRDFTMVRDRVLESVINNILFVLPFAIVGVGDYLKMRLARAIAGCYLDKKFVCALGDSNSGKGTITYAMSKAFVGFVCEWNANNLKYNARCGLDEAKKLAWIFPLLTARLAISNECRMDKGCIDGNLLKTLSSGGDVIHARQNFKDQSKLEIRTTFMYMGNDMPPITPNDSGIRTRLRAVRFVNCFVEKPTGPCELPADPEIKNKVGRLDWMNALFWIIMDAYRLPTTEPAEVLEETKEWIPNESCAFKEILEERYMIDLAGDGYVPFRELAECFKNQNLSDTKIGRELGKLGLIKAAKKECGKTIYIWRGIKKAIDIE
jgi:phage/plasmid-associated DNA primase